MLTLFMHVSSILSWSLSHAATSPKPPSKWTIMDHSFLLQLFKMSHFLTIYPTDVATSSWIIPWVSTAVGFVILMILGCTMTLLFTVCYKGIDN